jgi:hypothetical protein
MRLHYCLLGRTSNNPSTDASYRTAAAGARELPHGATRHPQPHFRSRFLLISSLNFRMSSKVRRGL